MLKVSGPKKDSESIRSGSGPVAPARRVRRSTDAAAPEQQHAAAPEQLHAAAPEQPQHLNPFVYLSLQMDIKPIKSEEYLKKLTWLLITHKLNTRVSAAELAVKLHTTPQTVQRWCNTTSGPYLPSRQGAWNILSFLIEQGVLDRERYKDQLKEIRSEPQTP